MYCACEMSLLQHLRSISRKVRSIHTSHGTSQLTTTKRKVPMRLNNRWFVCAPVILGAVVTLLSLRGKAHADSPPSPQQIQFAQDTSELMLKTLIAALLQEFEETTP